MERDISNERKEKTGRPEPSYPIKVYMKNLNKRM